MKQDIQIPIFFSYLVTNNTPGLINPDLCYSKKLKSSFTNINSGFNFFKSPDFEFLDIPGYFN